MTFHVPGDTWPVPNPDVTPALVDEAFAEPAPAPDETTVGPDLVEVVARAMCTTSFEYCSHPDEHRLRASWVLAALAEHGALMPTGGETRDEWGVLEGDDIVLCRREDCPRPVDHTHRRTVTTWPEGHPLAGTHYGL